MDYKKYDHSWVEAIIKATTANIKKASLSEHQYLSILGGQGICSDEEIVEFLGTNRAEYQVLPTIQALAVSLYDSCYTVIYYFEEVLAHTSNSYWEIIFDDLSYGIDEDYYPQYPDEEIWY